MVFTKLLLENALAIRTCNYEAALEPLLPKVARCIPVLSSRYIGKYAVRVLKRSETNHQEVRFEKRRVLGGFWQHTGPHSYDRNVSAFADMMFETFRLITSDYPDLIPKRNLQLLLKPGFHIANFDQDNCSTT